MALSEVYVVKLLEMWGLPPAGGTITVTALVHWPFSNSQSWESTYNAGDITALVAACRTNISNLTTESQTLITPIIDRFEEIKYSPMKVTSAAGGAGGNLVDHAKERENLRQLTANLCGVAVPEGGFLAETQRTYGKSLAKWASSINDR